MSSEDKTGCEKMSYGGKKYCDTQEVEDHGAKTEGGV